MFVSRAQFCNHAARSPVLPPVQMDRRIDKHTQESSDALCHRTNYGNSAQQYLKKQTNITLMQFVKLIAMSGAKTVNDATVSTYHGVTFL